MSPMALISRQIREVLEDALDPDVASAVFFEALTGRDELPESREQAVFLVRGPLYSALTRRIEEADASRLVTRILGRIDPSSSGLRSPRDEEPTRSVPTDSLPVEVAVIGAGDHFAAKLNTVLGPARVHAVKATGAAGWSEEHGPAVVVVDATDFLPIAAHEVVDALRALPDTTIRVLWGSELPYGLGVARATRPDDPILLTLPLGGGIEPLLDVIRSRRVEL